jgi:phenylacetate-CoA ligase
MIKKKIAEYLGIFSKDIFKGFSINKYLNLYLKSINWSKDEIQSYQTSNIKKLLDYAYLNVPFYTHRFDDAGFDYRKFRYLDELKKIPTLTRFDLQNFGPELISGERDNFKISKGSSSGSTGEPVIYYHDQFGKSANNAAVLFGKILGGYELGDPWTNVWGNPTAVNNDWKKTSSKISKFLFNETRYAAFSLQSNVQFAELIDVIKNHNSEFLYGYTNAIYLLANFIENEKINFTKMKGVFTTAENLQDFQRSKIEANLGKVFDHYGSSEINGVAAQTIYDDFYSVIEPHVYVEFDNYEKSNENGLQKFIITDLHNKVFPFIRYENGDLGKPVEVNVNSKLKFSKIKQIDGRISDIIPLPEGGSLVVPSFFGSRMLKKVDGIKQYQIIMKSKNELEVNLISEKNIDENSKTIIKNTLSEYLPKSLKYSLVYNNPIIQSKTGKFKLLIDQSTK